MPSIPTCHEMPKSATHERSTSNWNPASPGSNAASSHTAIAAVAPVNSSATRRWSSPRDLGTSTTSRAPTAGSATSAVRMSNDGTPSASVANSVASIRGTAL